MDDAQGTTVMTAGVAHPVVAGQHRHSTRPFIVTPRRAGFRHLGGELWRYRLLIGYFGLRFVQKKSARTWLGILWLPLRPGINLLLRIIVFGAFVGIKSGTRVPYSIFFIVAQSVWTLFYETAYWSIRSIEVNRKMLGRIYVPRLIIMGSSLIPAAVDFAINLSFGLLAVLYYVIRAHIFYLSFGLHTLLVPAGLFLMLLLGLGVGLLMSGIGARARDVRFGIHYFFQFLYYLTPVIYPITAIPNSARPFAELNPMTGAIEMVKDGLFAGHELSTDAIFVTLIWVFVIWVPGLWLYDRSQVALLEGRRARPWQRQGASALEPPVG